MLEINADIDLIILTLHIAMDLNRFSILMEMLVSVYLLLFACDKLG